MVHGHVLAIVFALLGLSACAAAPAAVPTPLVQTVVVTQMVEVEVTREVEVIVTATPRPATPTPVVTATPEAPPLALSRDVEALNSPAEGYNTVAELTAGTAIETTAQVDGWVAITVNGEEAWVPTDAIEGDVSGVPAYSDPLPVFDGEIVQDYLADSVLFKGRVRNVGGAVAQSVRVEIELVDANDNRLELADALVDGFDIAPGADASFQVIMDDVSGWEFYNPLIRWQE